MTYLREVMGSLSEKGRAVVVVAVIVALLALALLLTWKGSDMTAFWSFLGG